MTAGASGDATGERNGSGGAVNDHASSDDAILTTRDVEATKVLTGTDRAHTTGSALAIGEEATFTATVTVPEGVTPAAVFRDTFDTPGFELVSVAASFGADLSAATPDPTPSTSAGSVELDFGDITNAPDGITDAEDQLVVTVVLRAANVAGNDDGVTIANTSAALRWTGGSSISGLVATSVVEPELVVTKSMSPTEADAGDTVTVTVSVAHAPGSTADAFDVELTDTIPSGLSYVPASVSDTGPVAADSLSGSASSIDAAWDALPIGAVGSVSFEATLDGDVAPGQIITNTATATWTSLPGDVPGERTGDGGVDDHADADSATVTVPTATIDKRAVAGDHAPSVLPDVVVGETVTYAVDLTFPEGVTGSFDLVDDIPAGMAYVTGSASVDDSGLAGTLSAFDVDEPVGDGADLTVTFTGDTTVTADGDPANNSVTVTYQLVVLDVVGNGTELTNTASAFGDSDAVTVTAVRPDLSIDKDDGDATGTAGGTVVYTLSYANDGGIAAPSAVVTEVVPDGVLFSSTGSTPGWTCADGAASGTQCAIDVGDVAPGTGGSVDFAVRLPDPVPAGFESIDNSASIADDGSNGADVDTDDQSDNDTTPVDAAPVLEITKDDGGAAVNPGDTIAYTLEVTNTGDQAATGVVVTETVPSNTTFDSSGSSGSWSCPDGSPAATTCELVIGDLAVGAVSTAVFSVLVDEPLPDGVLQVANTATVSDDGAGTGGTRVTDTDDDTTPVTAEADLSIVKSTSTPSVDGGDEVRYRLQLANAGPNAAAGPVTVADTLPPEVLLDSVDGAATGWACVVLGNGFTCTYGDPAIDAPVGTLGEVEVTATAAVDVDGTVTNTATIDSSTDDPDGSDNSSSADVELRATADLSIAKSHAPASFVAGGTGTFTLAVANDGPSDSVATVDDPITVVDPMPAGITISAVSAPGWDCSATTPARLSCDWGETVPAAGPDPAAIVIAVDLDDDVVDVDGLAVELDNTATVAPGRTPDENPDNDDATDRVTVDPSADLGIQKVLEGELVAGDPATYVLTVTNSGPSTVAGDITVVDELPDGLSFSGATSDEPWDCAAAGDEVTCTLAGPTPVGAESTIRLEVLVDPDTPSPVVNTATISSGTSDPNPDNDVDTTDGGSGVTPSVDLSIAKTAPAATASVGGTVEFTLVVANTGPNATSGTTTVTDTLPDGLTAESVDAPDGWTCDPLTGQEVRCRTTDAIPVDGSAGPFRVVARVGPAAYPAAINVAAVAADPSIDEDDPTNNDDEAEVDVESSADLAIDKSHDGQFAVGVESRWRLVVTNNGPTAHPGPFTVSDPLPAGVTPVAATGDDVDCTIAAQVVTCVHPEPLAIGDSAAIEVTVVPSPGAEGTIVNTASVTSPETDPVPGNDADSDEVVVAPSFDLSVDKVLDGAPIAGDEVDWLLVVTNAGPSPSTDITLEDRLPDGLVATQATSDDPTVDCDLRPGAVTCTRPGRLEVGGQFTLRLTTEVTAPAGSEVRNVATVSAEGDLDESNDSAVAAGSVETGAVDAGAADAAPPMADGSGAATPPGTLPLHRRRRSRGPTRADAARPGLCSGGGVGGAQAPPGLSRSAPTSLSAIARRAASGVSALRTAQGRIATHSAATATRSQPKGIQPRPPPKLPA